ncbi:MAG: hypothetical protein GQ534_00905, partial [Candidatus Delongbacteria bacterium]|nr:hypothetical protein [Candidatus Delongbacteria bacterium]
YGTTADGGSGANMSVSATALQEHWYYNTTYTTVGSVADPAQDASIIQAELDARRPWWWAGGVHSFILDGYTDDYWYHFNWGWAGDQDGWFQIIFLVPVHIGGDYTSSQYRISCVPDTDIFGINWPVPENFTGQVLNDEDVELTWTAPVGDNQDSYNIWKTINGASAVLLANTANTFFSDLNQVTGDYSYYVTAVYSDGESHNTDSYSVDIQESIAYPVADNLSATPVGRTSIDLEWTIPFTGIIFFEEDFEAGMISTDWVQKTSENLKGDSKPVRQFFYEDDLDEIRLLDRDSAPHIVTHGYYACIFSADAERNLWLFSPEFTFNTTSLINFWTRFKYGGDIGDENVIFNIVAYNGDFTEENGATYDVIGRWDSSVDPENDWESEWEVSLATLDGQTKRVGFMVEANANDYYTFAIDDIVIGSTSGGIPDDPTGYEVYRNNILATTINNPEATFWADLGFADGDNEYFIRVLYPTGHSIPSEEVSVFMDANLKPDYLTGIFNGAEVDLSWYMPYGTPSHWSAYIDPQNCTTTVDYLDDTDCARRRVEFRAEDLGLYYPVTIDSIAAGFYEWEDEAWNSDTFIIRLWDGHPSDGSGTLLWESGTLTATSGEIYSVALDMPYALNNEWNVEVEALDGTTGHPSTLAGPSTSGINSYFFYTLEDSYNYYVSSGGLPLTYCMLAYVIGGDPDPIVKSGWTAKKDLVEKLPMIDNRIREITDLEINGKGLDCYNIYRNDALIGTTTTTNYTDNPTYGTYYYKVTALYANPFGESTPSNEICIYPPPGPDPFYTSVELEITGSLITITWESLAEATGYNVYSSSDPYGTFTLVGSTSELFFDTTVFGDKRFYYVVGTIDRKEPLKEIKVRNSNMK